MTADLAHSTDTRYRRLDGRSWVRDHLGEWTSGGYALVVHVTGPNDVSPIERRSSYDPRCGWCYLGANHSTDEHARKLAQR